MLSVFLREEWAALQQQQQQLRLLRHLAGHLARSGIRLEPPALRAAHSGLLLGLALADLGDRVIVSGRLTEAFYVHG
jgi:hypothetical protein